MTKKNDKLMVKMQRIRYIKPEFFQHEGLFDLEESTKLPIRVAYSGLWTCCDKHGRFEWRPRRLKLQILPYDAAVDFSEILSALEKTRFVVPYEVNGERYGYIPSWRKHQYIGSSERKNKFSYPTPPGQDDSLPEEAEQSGENSSDSVGNGFETVLEPFDSRKGKVMDNVNGAGFIALMLADMNH